MSQTPLRARPPRTARLALAAALLIATAGTARPGSAQIKPSVSVQGGPAEGEVTVRMTDLPPLTPIVVGFGGIGTPHELVGRQTTDAEGHLSVDVTVPAWAEQNRSYLFFVAYADQRPWGFSDPFVVTDPDGALRVSGEISDTAAGCLILSSHDGTRYVLLGETGPRDVGSRVVVEGTLATADAGADEDSPCARGAIRIQVRQIRDG